MVRRLQELDRIVAELYGAEKVGELHRDITGGRTVPISRMLKVAKQQRASLQQNGGAA
jgi:hypothetical protein